MVFRSPDDRRKLRSIIASGLLLFSLGHFAPATSNNGRPDYSWDIAVYDRFIASLTPDQKIVRFGDVGITPAQLRAFRERLVRLQSAAHNDVAPEPETVTPAGTTFKWLLGNVYYRFDPTQTGGATPTINAAKMQAVRDAVAEWAAFANLNFIEFTSPSPTNFITFSQQSANEGGFSSSVGMAGGEQFIQIGPNSWNRGTICHEVGHALGLWHEQQRPDRGTYVVIHSENINGDPGPPPTGDEGNFVIVPNGQTFGTAYDFYSVMHYSRNALSDDGGDTITMQPGYTQYLNVIGNVYDRTLSKLDRTGMAAIYGPPTVAPSATVTNTKDSGPGSLRSAIYYAFDRSTDAVPTPTTVTFNIPTTDSHFSGGVFTIQPTYLQVAPGAGTTIDGATEPNYPGVTTIGPKIMIDGSQIAAQNLSLFASGFYLHEVNCTIKNLAINGFNQNGIVLDGTRAALFGTTASGNVISGCYIGTDQTGSVGVANTFPGIELLGGASNNTIGGLTSAARNVISGNKAQGVQILNSGTNGNVVLGNYIGIDATGTSAIANGFVNPVTDSFVAGIDILGGAQNNVIGGSAAGAGNVISGNAASGVAISQAGANGNIVQGNFIGTNALGTAAIRNGYADPNAMPFPFFYGGVAIFGGAQNNVIGGTSAGAGNLISGNTAAGVSISDSGTTGNSVQGNLVGTNPAGTSALGNGFAAPSATPFPYLYAGVAVFGGAQSNTVGGLTSSASNVISGNAAQGVAISGSGTSSNFVRGNFIGINKAGAAAIPNGFEGVAVFGGASTNTIGGNIPGAGNVISGNSARGVGFFDAATNGNLVQGNLIGLNAAGSGAIANAFSGVECYLASNNTIGGTSPGARNCISGNSDRGVLIDGANASGNLVQGNTIGLTKSGTALPNTSAGVSMFTGAHRNTVGGSAAGASNVIASNSQEGVALFDSTTITNAISRNSIYSNQVRGIGIYTSSNNTPPEGPPTLSSSVLSSVANPNGTDVSGTLNSAANTNFIIEFFASPGGTDEGKNFIGSIGVSTDSGGSATFANVHLAAAVPIAPVQPGGSVITATATDANGNTSQFSTPVAVTATDSTGAGIPDNWMIAHFGHISPLAGEHANEDYDGDGLTNLQEFLGGTDPKSATSGLRITATTRSGNDLSITFNSVAGKTYRIESKSDLSATAWTLIEDQVLATAATTSITDFGATTLTRKFYRVALEP